MSINPEQDNLSSVKKLSQLRRGYVVDALNAGILIALGIHMPVAFLLATLSITKGIRGAIHAGKLKQKIIAEHEPGT